MRTPLLCLAAAVALSACGARAVPSDTVPPPHSASAVRFYNNVLPRCPYQELGNVAGRMADDLRRAAYALRAHAVLLERVDAQSTPGWPLAGMAIQFTDPNCRG